MAQEAAAPKKWKDAAELSSVQTSGNSKTSTIAANDKLAVEAGGGYIFEDRLKSANKSFGTYRGYAKYIRTLSPTAYASLAEAQKAGAATINYGLFLNTVINFLIVAGAIFIMITQIKKLEAKFEKPAAAAAPVTKECPLCLSVIPLKAVKCAHCASDLK